MCVLGHDSLTSLSTASRSPARCQAAWRRTMQTASLPTRVWLVSSLDCVRFDSGLTAVSKILKYENLLKTLLKMQYSFDMKNQAVIFCSYLTHNVDQSHSWFLPDNSYCNTRDLVLSSRQTWPRIHTLSTQRQFILPTAKQNGLFWTAASTREQSIGGVRNHWLKLFTFPRRERAYSSLHLLCILLPGETPPDCVSLVENKNHHC